MGKSSQDQDKKNTTTGENRPQLSHSWVHRNDQNGQKKKEKEGQTNTIDLFLNVIITSVY